MTGSWWADEHRDAVDNLIRRCHPFLQGFTVETRNLEMHLVWANSKRRCYDYSIVSTTNHALSSTDARLQRSYLIDVNAWSKMLPRDNIMS
jgi:hypothetical protein